MSKVNNVPALRFSGFWKEWEVKRLGTVCNKIMDGTHFSPKTKSGTKKYFTSKNIRNSGLDLSIYSFISDAEHHDIYKKCPVKFGDVLLTKDGANTGNCCINTLSEEFSLLSSVAVLNGEEKILSNIFLLQLLQSSKGVKEINISMAGQAIARVTLEKINKFKFTFPKYQEQQKIAAFLTQVDNKIEQLTQKKQLLADYKKGVMQQIFSQEIRFKQDGGSDYPDWKVKALREVGELTSSKRVYLSDYVESGIPFYRGKEITELKNNKSPSDILYITTEAYENFKSKYGVPLKNDILITAVGTLGNILRIRDDKEFYFKDGNLIWIKNISEYPNFLEKLLEYSKNEIIKVSIGSTQKALTIIELNKLKLNFPPLEEQQKIANFLTEIDTKLNQVEKQLSDTQQFKSGLLQQMFV